MRKINRHTGFAIALAWPETYCKQPGSWYDPITLFLGISENNYYKVGHAAVVLLDVENKKFHYFDFGRYHAPFGYGRVRGTETDDDLKINTIPKISEDGKEIENYKDLLSELQCNPSCHGEGSLYASYIPANFKSAFKKAMQMQNTGSIPYGPFKKNGSNCSRFVNTVILAGKPKWEYRFRLKYFVPLTPKPISNINSLRNKVILPKFLKNEPFLPINKLDKITLSSTLKQPEKHQNIPENAQWLSGEGAGSWFAFDVKDNFLQVSRFAPDSTLECRGVYKHQNNLSLLDENFTIIYPSNCKIITIVKKGSKVRFERTLV